MPTGYPLRGLTKLSKQCKKKTNVLKWNSYTSSPCKFNFRNKIYKYFLFIIRTMGIGERMCICYILINWWNVLFMTQCVWVVVNRLNLWICLAWTDYFEQILFTRTKVILDRKKWTLYCAQHSRVQSVVNKSEFRGIF